MATKKNMKAMKKFGIDLQILSGEELKKLKIIGKNVWTGVRKGGAKCSH